MSGEKLIAGSTLKDVEAAKASGKNGTKSKVETVRKYAFTVLEYPLAIGMVVLGFLNWDHCPASPGIPLLLITLGVIEFVDTMMHIIITLTHQEKNVDLLSYRFLLILCYFVWMLALTGCVICSLVPEFEDSSSSDYCDRTTYAFSIICPLVYYVNIIVWCVVFCDC